MTRAQGNRGLSPIVSMSPIVSIATCFGMLAILCTPAVAVGENGYRLVRGSGAEVCEAYEKNLNAFRQKTPMECLRKVHPDYPEFRKPTQGYLRQPGILEKLDNFLWERDANPVYYLTEAQQRTWRASSEQLRLARAGYDAQRHQRAPFGHKVLTIDIDNDGVPDIVDLDQACGTVYGSLLLVLNKDESDVDYERTEKTMVHPRRKDTGLGEFRKLFPEERVAPADSRLGMRPSEDSLHYAFYDVFLYKGKTYFDVWWKGHPEILRAFGTQPDTLRVFTIEGNQRREVCAYRFEMK